MRQLGTEQDGWVAGVTFSSPRVEAVTTQRPQCPEQRLVSHESVGEGSPSSLWGRVVEKSPEYVGGYLSKELERHGQAGVKMFSSGPRAAAEEPWLGQQQDRRSQEQRLRVQLEAGG